MSDLKSQVAATNVRLKILQAQCNALQILSAQQASTPGGSSSIFGDAAHPAVQDAMGLPSRSSLLGSQDNQLMSSFPAACTRVVGSSIDKLLAYLWLNLRKGSRLY